MICLTRDFELIEIGRGGGIGDMLMCTPALRALKRLKPQSKVIFYGDHHGLLRGLPYIDELRPSLARPDTALTFSYETKQRESAHRHIAQLFADQLGLSLDDVWPDCVIDQHLVEQFRASWKSLPRPWIVINRRSSNWTPNKDWPDALWQELIASLDGICSVIEIGVPKLGVGSVKGLTYVDLVGQTTEAEMVAAIAACDLHVGPMSGPVHIAAAAGKRSVVIYGGYEHPAATAYPGNEALYSAVECAPCLLRDQCPHERKCLSMITVDMVTTKIWDVWNSSLDVAGAAIARPQVDGDVRKPELDRLISGGLAASHVLKTPSRLYVAYRPDSDVTYDRHPELRSLTNQWVNDNVDNNGGDLPRLYLLAMNIKQTMSDGVQGDFAELGVYKGNSAAVLAHYARTDGRTLFLFDTFCGFDSDDLSGVDEEKKQSFTDTSLEAVLRNVGEESVVCIKGRFPASVNSDVEDRRYAVVHLDCDLYEPMKAGLEFFYPRLSNGGILIIHDYGNEYWNGAKIAVDEFCETAHEGVVLMPDKSGTAILKKARRPAALPESLAGEHKASDDAIQRFLTPFMHERPSAVAATPVTDDFLATKLVSALYRVLLSREPEATGLDQHAKEIQDGRPIEDLMRAFLRSDEFATKSRKFLEAYPSLTATSLIRQQDKPRRELETFTVPVYIAHYTPLVERKCSILDQIHRANFSEYHFIDSMDAEVISEAQIAQYYDPDPQKWAKMIEKTRRLFIEANQWRPEKKSWSENVFDDGSVSIPFKKLTVGELSLCCKHAEALRQIAESGAERAIIFEDDVIFSDRFPEQFKSGIFDTPKCWDIIFLGSAFGHRPPERNMITKSYKMDPPRGKCSDSYVVNSASAKMLLDHMVPFTQPIDFELIYWMNELSLKCFWLDPPIVAQGSQTGEFPSSLRGNATKPQVAALV